MWCPLSCSLLTTELAQCDNLVIALFSSVIFLQIDRLIHWRRRWHPTPVLLPGKSHEQRSLVGCNPWGREESDTTERLHFHFSFSCIGEGNGNPLQWSCLENPRDRGAWWAAAYGVAQSWTQLKQLSSSNSSSPFTSWQIDVETVADFVFLGSEITTDGDCSVKLKDAYSFEGKLWLT